MHASVPDEAIDSDRAIIGIVPFGSRAQAQAQREMGGARTRRDPPADRSDSQRGALDGHGLRV
jgi:hypothetical protein